MRRLMLAEQSRCHCERQETGHKLCKTVVVSVIDGARADSIDASRLAICWRVLHVAIAAIALHLIDAHMAAI